MANIYRENIREMIENVSEPLKSVKWQFSVKMKQID